MENVARKLGLQINQEKTKYMVVERKNTLKQKKTIGHLKIENYKFERVENFKYLGVILHEDNNHQIHLKEIIKNAKKHTLCYKIF
jgi:glutaredoxin-related protein